MKRAMVVGAFVFVALVLSGCSQKSVETDVVNEGVDENVIEEVFDEVAGAQCDTSGDCGVKDGSGIREFNVTAKQYTYDPVEIEVNVGERVIINVTSADVPHSFTMTDFKDIDGEAINLYLAEGEKETVEFIADKKGEFVFGCDVYCGSGHGDMLGKLVVI